MKELFSTVFIIKEVIFMKLTRLLFLSVIVASCVFMFSAPQSNVSAQTVTIQIGATGYSYVNNVPFFDFYYLNPYTRAQLKYRATEINTALAAQGISAGTPVKFSSLSYQSAYWYNYGTGLSTYPVSIQMAATPDPWFYVPQPWGNPLPVWDPMAGGVQVFNRKNYTFNTTYSAWQTFTFDNFYQWDGASNVVIDNCLDGMGMGIGYCCYWWYYNTSNTYPPYVPNLWTYLTYTGTTVCTKPTVDNGYLTAHPIVQFDVCTGAASTVNFTVPATFVIPGHLLMPYTVGHPTGTFTATITVKFYTPAGVLMYTKVFTVPVNQNVVNGTADIDLTGANMVAGFYRVEVTFNTRNECGVLSNVVLNKSTMLLTAGMIPCYVWPGDVNNDNIVNFGDQKSLNTYIQNAGLKPTWLQGPARYRVDQSTNPMTYYTWEAQASVPWATPQGCYMDADGNGVVNNFDYLPIKANWMKTHGPIPKSSDPGVVDMFDVSQNYPNPFNPTTTLSFAVPEKSEVKVVVSDVTGREIKTLTNETFEAGAHNVYFDGSSQSSGTYFATVSIRGIESGSTFSKVVKMQLSK
jgi:hypothetical protein